jgi:hypothetical protein
MLYSQLQGAVFATWASSLAGASGSVSITTLNANRVQGTFTATLVGLGGLAMGSITLSGTFDIGRAGQG